MVDRGVARIVVGVDGSEQAAAALEWAIRIAKGMGYEVIAVFALDLPPWLVEPDAIVPPPQFDPELRKAMQEAFEESWCKPLRDAGVKYQAIMEDGRPASVVEGRAEGMDADLIVVGRRGRGEVAELLLGSVSHELVLHSKRPVLLVPHRPGA
jgi:nucleotide-binding universal stress UspA family protein